MNVGVPRIENALTVIGALSILLGRDEGVINVKLTHLLEDYVGRTCREVLAIRDRAGDRRVTLWVPVARSDYDWGPAVDKAVREVPEILKYRRKRYDVTGILLGDRFVYVEL
jgi:hypothetical protein